MNKITFANKNSGDKLLAVDVNEIKTTVNTNADLTPGIVSGDTPPPNPADNDLWFDTTYGKLRIYYNDGTSSQWVDAVIS
tara:strand:+ start:78 stop:317 length:240 start_codon:yes stop_codon:yes gene_type:complete